MQAPTAIGTGRGGGYGGTGPWPMVGSLTAGRGTGAPPKFSASGFLDAAHRQEDVVRAFLAAFFREDRSLSSTCVEV